MDWRALVLIGSLLLNAYFYSALRQLQYQAQELTQSAAKQRRELAAIANQLDQTIAASARASDGLDDAQLSTLIDQLTTAEMFARRPDCTAVSARNSSRLRALEARFRKFAAEFTEVSSKAQASDMTPARIQEMGAKLKAEVLAQCKR